MFSFRDVPWRSAESSDSFNAQIAAERSRIHARMVRTAAPGQLGFAVIAALVLLDHIPRVPLGVVLALLGLLVVVLALVARGLIRLDPDDTRLTDFRLRLTLVSMMFALIAGTAVALSLPLLPNVTRLIVTIALIAAYAVSIAAHHANPSTLLGVGLGMLGPVAVAWMAKGSLEEVMIGLALVALVLVAWYISVTAGGAIDEAIRARLRVAELSRRLEARSRDLEAAVRAKTQFLAAASHDLRQPVTSMNLLLSGFEQSQGPRGPGARRMHSQESAHEALATMAARMQPAIRAMGTILDSMLEMSRLEAGLVRASMAPIDLRELLLSIQIEYGPRAQANHLQLSTDVAAISIETDRDFLGRIVRNLVDNALKYTPSGSVSTSAWLDEGHCVISVQDTGLGIAPELHGRVFDDYFQAGNPNRDRGMGLGLGLSIVRRLVSLLGGRISLESQPGKGSRFEVRLPTASVQSAPAATLLQLTLTQALAGKSRLLVIDDDPLIRDAFDAILKEVPVEYRIATNPYEALAVVSKGGFAADVAIVDYRLPGGLNGLQVIENLVGDNPTLAAVLITGDLDPGLVGRVGDVRAALVNKPFSAGQLAAGVAIARQLAGSRTMLPLPPAAQWETGGP